MAIFRRAGNRHEGRGSGLPLALGLLVATLGFGQALGEDWPQTGGPRRDFMSTETGLADGWPVGGPKVVWETKGLGGGYASPVVAEGRVFVVGRETTGPIKGWGSQKVAPGPDVVWCLDRATGKVLWKHEFPLHLKAETSTAWCTPAADGGLVYARGGDGEVCCLSAKDGAEVWSWPKDKALLAQKGNQASYGYAAGLTLEGGLVIFQGLMPGSRNDSLVAADKKTGEVRWETPIKSWLHGARNPTLLDVKGRRLLIVAEQALDPQTGKKLGDCPSDEWWAGHGGNRLIVRFERKLKIPKDQEAEEQKKHGEGFDSEAGVQCLAVDLAADGAPQVQKLWEWSMRGTADYEPKGVKAFGGPIIIGGHAYSFIGIRRQGDRLMCLDMDTGKELWLAKVKVPVGTSHPLYADGKILVLNNGQLAMIAADPKGYRELGYAIVSLQSWAAPALSDGRLFLRDDAGTAKCLDLRAKPEPSKLAGPAAPAAEWPQLGGPKGDWTSPETGLLDKWPDAGPKALWEARAEPGFASPILAHGHVYLLGRKDWGLKRDKDGKPALTKDGKLVYDLGAGWDAGEGPAILRCLDHNTGKELWQYTFQTEKPDTPCPGPYVTPIADGDRVYAIDAARELVCLQAADGKAVWRQMGSGVLGRQNDRTRGATDRLLVLGGQLFCVGQAGEAMQLSALDKATGEFHWSKHFKPPKWQIRYTTPRPLTVGQGECLLLAGSDFLACLAPDSGSLWELKTGEQEQEFFEPWSCVTAGSRFYVHRGGKTLEAFEAAEGADGAVACKQLWTSEMRPGGAAIPAGDRLIVVGPGGDKRFVRAFEAATGKQAWEGRADRAEFSAGIAVDGKLVLTASGGELLLAQAAASEFKLLSRARIEGFEALWSPPALAGGHLVVRDCTGLVKCFDLKGP